MKRLIVIIFVPKILTAFPLYYKVYVVKRSKPNSKFKTFIYKVLGFKFQKGSLGKYSFEIVFRNMFIINHYLTSEVTHVKKSINITRASF